MENCERMLYMKFIFRNHIRVLLEKEWPTSSKGKDEVLDSRKKTPEKEKKWERNARVELKNLKNEISEIKELSNEEINSVNEYGKKIFEDVRKWKDINITEYLKWKEEELNKDKTTNKNILERKKVVLNTIKEIAEDSRMKDYWGSIISDTINTVFWNKKTTEEAFIQNSYIAIQSAAKTWIKTSVKVENGQYVTESMDETLRKIKTDIRSINAVQMKNYLASVWTDYNRFEKELWKEGIAAIGNYLKNVPDTKIFQWNESLKDYFLNSYSSLVNSQNMLLERKSEILSWSFEKLFPSLLKYSLIKTNLQIQKMIKEKNVWGAYDLLAWKITNSEMVKIMIDLEKDGNMIEKDGKKRLIIESEKWKWKKFKDIQIKVDWDVDKKTLEKLEKKSIATSSLSKEEVWFLLRVLPQWHELRLFIELYNQIEFWWSVAAKANTAARFTDKKNPNSTSTPLNTKQNEALYHTGNLRNAVSMNEVSQDLFKKNGNPNNAEEMKQLKESNMTNAKLIAISTAALVNNQELTNDDRRAIIRTNINSKLTDKEIDRFIDTQVFISKYVEEKNFVDLVEKNAAYMNIWETKSISELYGIEKIDISDMSSESGSVSLSETSILWNNTFTWMNDLMKCRVEIWSWPLTRTIRDPNLKIIKENIPLENIDTTIHQLSRFYSLWLWILAQHMEYVNASINANRSDKITWFDGSYEINEDMHFLKILAITLYWADCLRKIELNIPNLIRLFNRPEREFNPQFILKEKWILTDSWSINLALLDKDLEKSSKEVS